jgi:hypothetical protein
MAGQGVLVAPHEPDGPGEMGKAVVLPKDLTPEQKKLVDEGWQKNAFNQYVSDMISVHRTLPDPRDDRSDSFSFSFFFLQLLLQYLGLALLLLLVVVSIEQHPCRVDWPRNSTRITSRKSCRIFCDEEKSFFVFIQ